MHRVRNRQRRTAVRAADDCRYALPDQVLGVWPAEYPILRIAADGVAVYVDESRHDRETRYVEPQFGLALRKVADLHNAVATDANVRDDWCGVVARVHIAAG